MAINFQQKEYGMKRDQINNEYRDTQQSLKQQFLTDFHHKTSRNILNRQMLIEQQSDEIIQRRNDRELCGRHKVDDRDLDRHQMAAVADTKTKAISISLGSNTIQSKPWRHGLQSQSMDEDPLDADDGLKPIKFVWDQMDDEVDADRDDEDAVSSDFSFEAQPDIEYNHDDDVEEDGTFKMAVNEVRQWMDSGQIDIEQVLSRQLEVELVESKKKDSESMKEMLNDIAMHSLCFDPVHIVKELLMSWNTVQCASSTV